MKHNSYKRHHKHRQVIYTGQDQEYITIMNIYVPKIECKRRDKTTATKKLKLKTKKNKK